MIVCVDFDGTCVEHQYPEVGPDVPHAERVLKVLGAEGWQIILWTMRSGEHLDAAVRWFADREIELFGINENPQQTWSDSPKAYAQVYIDDAAAGCPHLPTAQRPMVDWLEIEKWLQIRNHIKK